MFRNLHERENDAVFMSVVKWDRSIKETWNEHWIYLHKNVPRDVFPPFRVHSHKCSETILAPVKSNDPTSSFLPVVSPAVSFFLGLFIDGKEFARSSHSTNNLKLRKNPSEEMQSRCGAKKFSGWRQACLGNISSLLIFIHILFLFARSADRANIILVCWSAFNNCILLIKIHFCLLTFE